jgi:hypothetical protein
MDNAILDTWIEAVASNPSLFQVDAIPHSRFSAISPIDGNPKLLAIRLHQEWALLSQLLWDQAFATLQKQNLARLTRYADSLVTTYNSADSDVALNTTWGFTPSVFRLPYLSRLRPFSSDTQTTLPVQLSLLSSVSVLDTPSFISPFTPIPITVPATARSAITCPPFLTTNQELPSSTEASQLEDLPEQGNKSTPTRSSLPTPKNPFACESPRSPPAKRKRTLDILDFPTSKSPNNPSDQPSDEESMPPPPSQWRSFNPVPANVPLSGSARGNITDTDSSWSMPFSARGQFPLPTLPLSSRGRSAALLTAVRQSQKSTSSLAPIATNDANMVTFEFSRDLMLSHHACKTPVRRWAFWGSWRCGLISDPPFLTIDSDPAQYDYDYLFAPGRLNPELIPLFRQAYQKKPGHPAFADLTSWFETECIQSETEDDNIILPCHIQPSFFNQSVIQALLGFAFQSGYKSRKNDEPIGILTPWSFIRSLDDFATVTQPRIPTTGLLAHQVSNLLDNIIYLMSLLSHDNRDIKTLGTGHSAFSRFSPLAGHLLLLASYFRRNAFQAHWDHKLIPSTRFTFTKAAFIAIAELFQLYDSWLKPIEDNRDVFRMASCGSANDLILLTPAIDASGRRHLPFFIQWREQIQVFTIDRLQTDIPREGFFAKATPACYLPRPNSIPPQSILRSLTPSVSFTPSDHSLSSSTLSTNTRSHPNRSDRYPDRDRNAPRSVFNTPRQPNHYGPSGESQRPANPVQPQGAIARTPAITSAADQGLLRPLTATLREINQGRAAENKVNLPMCQLVGQPRPIPLCFRFSAAGGPGCPSPQTCRYLHLDLADRDWIRQNIPPTYLQSLLTFLQRPEVRPYYSPTPELVAFLGRR